MILRRWFWASLLALLVCALAAPRSEASGGGDEHAAKAESLEFRTLARGGVSSYGTAEGAITQTHEALVVTDAEGWRRLWRQHRGSDSERPAVDFSKEMVLAVFAGPRGPLSVQQVAQLEAGKGGGLEISELLAGEDGGVTVRYKDDSAGLPAVPKGRRANPFHFVACARASGAVSFAVTAASGGHSVSGGVTALFGALLLAMVLCLAFEEKIHAKKSVITGSFAILSLFLGASFGILPLGDSRNAWGEALPHLPVYIAAIDWEVISIILAASIFVDVTSKSGIFTWIAIKLTKASGGDPLRLLVFYGAMTVIFSAVLNNVTAMIIVGSLTGVSLNKLKKTEWMLGFLLVEGLLTNVGGLLTLISSVPNIIVGNAAKIGFVDFFFAAAPYVFFASVLTLWLGARLYGIKALGNDEERAAGRAQVSGFDENDGIESRAFFNFSAAIFVLFILVLASTSNLPVLSELKMGYVAFMFAMVMLCVYKSQADKFYAKVDWDLIFFFATLFVVINVMEHAQVLKKIGGVIALLLKLGPTSGPISLLWGSAAASSVTDNIPLAAVLAKILEAQEPARTFWWSVIFGANLGGNITPIGSASTVVAVTVMHKNGLGLSFGGFVKAAVPFAVLQLLLASAYLTLLPNSGGFPILPWGLLGLGVAALVVRSRMAG